MLGLDEVLEPGETSGQFDDRYTWYQRVEEVMAFDDTGIDLAELPVALYSVELVVEWGDNPTREAVFRTLRSVDMHWEERQLMGPVP